MNGGFQVGPFQTNYQQVAGAPTGLVEEPVVAYWRTKKEKRLTEEELRELIRQQRIALGILPPDIKNLPLPEAEDVANEVAAAVNDVVAMSDFPIDYKTIYRQAYLEAEHAIAEYRKAKRKRKAAAFMLLH